MSGCEQRPDAIGHSGPDGQHNHESERWDGMPTRDQRLDSVGRTFQHVAEDVLLAREDARGRTSGCAGRSSVDDVIVAVAVAVEDPNNADIDTNDDAGTVDDVVVVDSKVSVRMCQR